MSQLTYEREDKENIYYSVSKEYKHLLSDDGVHFINEGYEMIAKTILDKITEVLPDYKL